MLFRNKLLNEWNKQKKEKELRNKTQRVDEFFNLDDLKVEDQ